MMRVQLPGSSQHQRMLILGLMTLLACSDSARTVTSPNKPSLAAARAAGGNGPTVKSTDPDSATIDTTLNVRVIGSGYDQGSRADWAFKGVVSENIVTNSTKFVSSTELVANITISRNANIGSHDVIVTTSSGKGGIGTELFEVTVKPITDLGTLDGASVSYARGINSNGTTIIGRSGERPVRWTFTNDSWMIEDLAPLIGTTTSYLVEVNNDGDIVGYMNLSDGTHAFLLTASGETIDLHYAPMCSGTAEPWQHTSAYGVNNRREVVIVAYDPPNASAFHWADGCMTKLPALGPLTDARGINDNGLIAGASGGLPVRWMRNGDGTWTVTVLPLPSGCQTGWAGAINATGMAAGNCFDTKTGKRLALRWSASGALTVLPALARGDSEIHEINDAGDVAGQSVRRDGMSVRAVLWPIAGGIKDLGAIVGSSQAWGVNDNKQVVGSSQVPDGNTWPHHALLWTLP
jgi:uncharacterized membrane protein